MAVIRQGQRVTLLKAVQILTREYGSQAEAARQCEVDKTYWSRLMNGFKDWPSDETLERMGLQRNVSYEWVTPPGDRKAA